MARCLRNHRLRAATFRAEPAMSGNIIATTINIQQ
jgi:hypothetical protein